MNILTLDDLQGREVEVIDLHLVRSDDKASLIMTLLLQGISVSLYFDNIYCLSINDFSLPFQICGLEIVSNKERGWENSSMYTIRDYEDNKLHFYCEKIDIL